MFQEPCLRVQDRIGLVGVYVYLAEADSLDVFGVGALGG